MMLSGKLKLMLSGKLKLITVTCVKEGIVGSEKIGRWGGGGGRGGGVR